MRMDGVFICAPQASSASGAEAVNVIQVTRLFQRFPLITLADGPTSTALTVRHWRPHRGM